MRVSTISAAVRLNDLEFYQYMMAERLATKAMDEGTILHSLILEGKYPDKLKILDFPDYRTKAAQEAKAETITQGLIPMLTKEMAAYETRDFKELRLIFDGCAVEKEVKGKHYLLGNITGHIDALDHRPHVWDLKCINTNNFSKLFSTIFYNAYDVQLYLYMLLSKSKTSTIVFYNFDTGIYQMVNLALEDIQASCQKRIEEIAAPRIERYNSLKKGTKQLETLVYLPYEKGKYYA